jgi:hypothetical protein
MVMLIRDFGPYGTIFMYICVYYFRMRRAGNIARMGEERKVYRVLVGKPEGKRPLGRPRLRWENGIRMDHMEIGWEGEVDPTGLGYGPMVDCCEYGDKASGSGAMGLVC